MSEEILQNIPLEKNEDERNPQESETQMNAVDQGGEDLLCALSDHITLMVREYLSEKPEERKRKIYRTKQFATLDQIKKFSSTTRMKEIFMIIDDLKKIMEEDLLATTTKLSQKEEMIMSELKIYLSLSNGIYRYTHFSSSECASLFSQLCETFAQYAEYMQQSLGTFTQTENINLPVLINVTHGVLQCKNEQIFQECEEKIVQDLKAQKIVSYNQKIQARYYYNVIRSLKSDSNTPATELFYKELLAKFVPLLGEMHDVEKLRIFECLLSIESKDKDIHAFLEQILLSLTAECFAHISPVKIKEYLALLNFGGCQIPAVFDMFTRQFCNTIRNVENRHILRNTMFAPIVQSLGHAQSTMTLEQGEIVMEYFVQHLMKHHSDASMYSTYRADLFADTVLGLA